MLEANSINVSIAGTQILRSANLAVGPSRTVGLIGRNGAGKTTFMRAVMGLIEVSDGEIRIGDETVSDRPPHVRAALGVGYMPEDRRLIPEFSVEDNILLPIRALGRSLDRKRLNWVYELMPEIARFATPPRAFALRRSTKARGAWARVDRRRTPAVARRALRGRRAGARAAAGRSDRRVAQRGAVGPAVGVRSCSLSFLARCAVRYRAWGGGRKRERSWRGVGGVK